MVIIMIQSALEEMLRDAAFVSCNLVMKNENPHMPILSMMININPARNMPPIFFFIPDLLLAHVLQAFFLK